MTTYRLPDDLGGWPVETSGPTGNRTVIADGPHKGVVLAFPRSGLVAVAPPLPDEPPVGSVVRALMSGEDEPWMFERTPAIGGTTGWYTTSDETPYEWADLCKCGTPVLLVPDPVRDAPELPYEHTDVDGDRARIELTASGARLTCQGTDGQIVAVFVDRAFALAALRATTKEER